MLHPSGRVVARNAALFEPVETVVARRLDDNHRVVREIAFRLGEQPNIRVGVAMITSAPEALALHDKMAKDLWSRALKGAGAVRFMRE